MGGLWIMDGFLVILSYLTFLVSRVGRFGVFLNLMFLPLLPLQMMSFQNGRENKALVCTQQHGRNFTLNIFSSRRSVAPSCAFHPAHQKKRRQFRCRLRVEKESRGQVSAPRRPWHSVPCQLSKTRISRSCVLKLIQLQTS